MDRSLEMKLWNAGQAEAHTYSTWQEIVKSLLDDFALFLGQGFERDHDINLEPRSPSPSFTQWMWSPFKPGPLSVAWSAVIAGNMSVNSDGRETFTVVLDLFLFDASNHRRLRTNNGESFVQFVFEPRSGGKGGWRCLGWCVDEWGEWDSLNYPEETHRK